MRDYFDNGWLGSRWGHRTLYTYRPGSASSTGNASPRAHLPASGPNALLGFQVSMWCGNFRPMAHATDRCRAFRQLHQSGCFVIPNPWDLGSARLLTQLGFPALATTSSGFAWSLGRPDNRVSLEETLGHLRSIAHDVQVPVNADFEGGFATAPAEVAANVAAATATGIAGLSIEDS